jgi:aspartyl-tRNA synthetase
VARGRRGAGPLANNIGGTDGSYTRCLGIEGGDAAFFVAGDPDKFWKFSGLARTRLGEELNLIDKDRFELAWIVDFLMYEYNGKEEGRLLAQSVFDALAARRCKVRNR